MGEFVGETRDPEVFTQSHMWYHDHEWTIEQNDQFKKWLVNYLYTNTSARREFSIHAKTKKYLKLWADSFAMNYGWKFKQVLHENSKF